MRIEEDLKLDYQDVLIRPKRSTLTSRKEVELVRELKFKRLQKELACVPIVAANMDGVGTMKMAKVLIAEKMLTALHKFYSVEELKTFFEKIGETGSKYVFYSLGLNESDEEKLDELLKVVNPSLVKNLCLDVANGYTEKFADFVKRIRAKYPDKVIMAGNVVTGEMTEQLILSGADIVKIGIGPGSVCTTRKMTGVGYPQLSAVIECADAAHGIGGMICADGGCQVPGDIAKAFGGGADLVMLGAMLAGHTESELEIMENNGEKCLKYYGSSSREAMDKHFGGVAKYRAAEGKCVHIDYRGSVKETASEILGGLRSACTYVGAGKLKEMPKRTTFIRTSRQLNGLFS